MREAQIHVTSPTVTIISLSEIVGQVRHRTSDFPHDLCDHVHQPSKMGGMVFVHRLFNTPSV